LCEEGERKAKEEGDFPRTKKPGKSFDLLGVCFFLG